MLPISILALLATMALADPLPSTDLLLKDRSPSGASSYITACEAAVNCETYIEPTTGRPNVRFKPGMEPGTDAYNSRHANSTIKRQSGSPKTQVTLGDNTIYWGCGIDPVATLNNVSSICATSGQCLTDPFSTSITYVVPKSTSWTSDNLTITAVGTYPSWMRNGLVEGVQAAMSAHGVIKTTTEYYSVDVIPTTLHGLDTKDVACQVAKAPNDIGLSVYSGNYLEATIRVNIALVPPPESGFCSTFSSIAGAIVSVFGTAGADLAAIFGIVGAACGA